MKLLQKQLQVNVDKKQGFVSISASMPEGLQAAQMVLSAQNILQRKVSIIDLKLKKILALLKNVIMKKKAFEQAQSNLTDTDVNRNVNTQPHKQRSNV